MGYALASHLGRPGQLPTYQRLEDTNEQPRWLPNTPRTGCRSWLHILARSRSYQAAALLLFIFLLFFGNINHEDPRRTPKISIPEQIIRSWAQYSPAFPVDVYKLPTECVVTQVNILQRHGARYPTLNAGVRILNAILKMKNATAYHDPRLQFLTTYTYDLGYDDLINYGAAQSFDSGYEAFSRYSTLVSQEALPFVRASSAARVVSSATNWTAGFVLASGGAIIPAAPLILNEAANDTLDDKMCPMAGDSDTQTDIWQDTFAPAVVQRLNSAAPGANLLNADVPSLISLCAFETLAREAPSPWCTIFDQQDFDNFEYNGDLDKYYNTGYGQPLGPVQGVGYVNELLARLTGKPVSDATQTNTTLDSSPDTFPLNRTLYADFSHDNQMIAIYAAMGIMRPPSALDPARPDSRRTWITSHLAPFNGKLVIEKLDCNGRESIRMLLNDAVVPLDICGAAQDGVCALDAFVQSQAYARNNGNGDWQRCFS